MSLMPVIFVGHGSPMNATEDNDYTQSLARWGIDLRQHGPRAILCVSAHWVTEGTRVTAMAHPRTIHDFNGFPAELYRMAYPAAGDPPLAARVRALAGMDAVLPDQAWGLDHGAWTVLHHMFPNADIPVVQLSLDARLPAAGHMDLARRLAPLRAEGVLVMGSGNVVHSFEGFRSPVSQAPAWAEAFDARVADALRAGDVSALARWETLTPDARRAHPTPEHFWPLLYPAALAETGEAPRFPYEGLQYGTMSMRCVQWGD